jgi:hypothetical protein
MTTVVALAAFQALAVVGALPAFASSCDFAGGTLVLDFTPGDDVTLHVDAQGEIEFNDGGGFQNCDTATNANTNTIIVTGSNDDDDLTIDEDNGGPFNATSWDIDMGDDDDDVNFDLDDGNDTFVLTNTGFTMNGAVGTLTMGNDDEFIDLEGSEGDDTLDASAVLLMDVDIDGDAGDDFIASGTGIDDELAGDGGVDTLSYQTRTTCMYIENGDEAGADLNCDGDNNDPTEESDDLVGTNSGCFEIVISGSGNDLIDDSTCGDTVYAPGAGDDDVINDADGDTIDFSSSGQGGVVINHPAGTATGEGNDTFEDADNFIGTELDDTLLIDDDAPGGVDSFSGLGGVDLVDATAAPGPGGVDVNLDDLDPVTDDLENLIGSAFSDTNLTGNQNNNRIWGMAGNDVIEGGDGADWFDGGTGNDDFEGDDGRDTVSFLSNTTAGVTVDLSLEFASSPESGDDDFSDEEEVIIGTNFADTITGGPFAGGGTINYLFKGKAGVDNLTGFNGNDTLNGGKNGDVIRGAGGADTLLGKKGPDDLYGGAGTDVGKGGPGFDECFGVESAFSCV